MNLDIGTIIFLTCLITFTMGAILFIASRSNPPQIKGVKEWAWACLIQGCSWLLLGGRGQIPDFFSIVLANSLLVVVVTMQFQSILRFKERKSYGVWLFLPAVASFLILNYFTYITPEIAVRTVSTSLICMCFCLFSGYFFIFRQRHPIILSEWILSIVFLLIGAVLLTRNIYIWWFDASLAYLFTQSKVQTMVFSTICIANVLLTFSFAMILNERFKEEILRLAKIDPLTEVYNRAAMEQLFKNELNRAVRYQSAVSLLMLDLDFFKTINDTYGHQVGDKTLKTFVDSISTQLRTTDILVRYGGEEFALLLSDSDKSGAENAAERLRRKVQNTVIEIDGYQFTITVSIGIAEFGIADDNLEKLISRADTALYQAKQAGRNRVVSFAGIEPLRRKTASKKLKLAS